MAKISLTTLTAAFLVAFVPAAPAAPTTVYITTDETIGTLPPKPVTVVIGYADASHSVPFSPTVGFNASSDGANIVDTYNSSVLNMTGGGTLGTINAYNNSAINISGDALAGQVSGHDSATLNITGGTETTINADDSSTVNFSNASTSNLNAAGGTVNMTGGTVAQINVDSGTFNLEGGSLVPTGIVEPIYALGGTLNIYGSGLTIGPGTGPAPGPTTVIEISGTLLDGSPFDVDVLVNSSGYDINLINVPEPSTFVMALIASVVGIGCAARRHLTLCTFDFLQDS